MGRWPRVRAWLPDGTGRKSVRWLGQTAAFTLPAAGVLLLFGGSQASLECGGPEVRQEIVGLFHRQLKLTPYARFIDVAKADVTIEAVFDVAKNSGSRSCVAFATYDAQLNDAGQHVEGRERLRASLLYELSGEKQIFYTVKLTSGRKNVRVNRISG